MKDGKYTDTYIGIIEDTADERKEGRCRVRVFGVHDDIPVEDLPWAYPTQKSTFFGQEGGAGSISIPKTGAFVSIKFNNGNMYSPEYNGIHELEETLKEELNKEGEYAGTHIMLFDGDEELKIWFTINKGITIELKGSRINIGQDKAITIEHADTSSSIELRGGEINITANSTVNIVSKDEILTRSNDVHIDGNFVKIGHSAITGSAVLGDNLFILLTSLATMIDAKVPSSIGAATGMVDTFKAFSLSETVKVSK